MRLCHEAMLLAKLKHPNIIAMKVGVKRHWRVGLPLTTRCGTGLRYVLSISQPSHNVFASGVLGRASWPLFAPGGVHCGWQPLSTPARATLRKLAFRFPPCSHIYISPGRGYLSFCASTISNRICPAQAPTNLVQIKLMYDLASALAYLHSHSVLHCDINTTNVMLRNCVSAVVIDFGESVRVTSMQRDIHSGRRKDSDMSHPIPEWSLPPGVSYLGWMFSFGGFFSRLRARLARFPRVLGAVAHSRRPRRSSSRPCQTSFCVP